MRDYLTYFNETGVEPIDEILESIETLYIELYEDWSLDQFKMIQDSCNEAAEKWKELRRKAASHRKE